MNTDTWYHQFLDLDWTPQYGFRGSKGLKKDSKTTLIVNCDLFSMKIQD